MGYKSITVYGLITPKDKKQHFQLNVLEPRHNNGLFFR